MRARLQISALLLTVLPASSLPAAPAALRGDITVRHILDTGGGGNSIRIARDPGDGFLYYLRESGSIYRLTVREGSASTSQRIYQGADTGVSAPTGFAFGPDGTVYIVGMQASGNTNVASIRAGVRSAPGSDARVWATVARTEAYPRSNTAFDHNWNGITVSPDGEHLYIAAGSRTDHGEVQSAGGAFPGVREVPLTAAIFRIPTSARDLLLENDEVAIEAHVFVRGVRNSFDPAFSPGGELFAGENSGDRDDSEELNWLRQGRHYGFPWRMGGSDTPQQFPGYDPEADRLVDHDFYAYQRGFFHDDPSYPPPPPVELTEPCLNFGPDADSYRDPTTGEVLDAGARATPLGTFTAHRSPLGLVFDREGALGGDFHGDAFILGWTRGDAAGSSVNGPFEDPGQDMLHVEIELPGGACHITATRIVGGFTNPIDAEIVRNRIYVLDHGGNGAIWEVTLPEGNPAPVLRRGFVNADAEGDISDGVAILLALFAGGTPACLDAADVDDTGSVDITDAVAWLQHLFQGAPPPPAPHAACGPDETPDVGGDLGCEGSPACEG